MKKLILTLSMALASQSFAAELPAGMTEAKTLTNPYLQLVRELAQTTIERELFGSCGDVRAVKLDSVEGISLVQSIESMLTNEYVEELSVTPLLPKPKNEDDEYAALKKVVSSSVNWFTGDPDYCDDSILGTQVATQDSLESLILLANEESGNTLKFFGGSIGGAFDLSVSFMAIVDTKNGEILTAGEGYCE